MSNDIKTITPIHFSELPKISIAPTAQPSAVGDDSAFGKMLGQIVTQTANTERAAEQSNQKFTTVEMGHLHENAINLEKANISLRLLVNVRNKVIDAYHQVMQMNA